MSLTPMMRQYHEMKSQAEGALLLFRMGDFYELFFDDAEEASRLLGLTLTSREKGENAIPMAGFPHHSLEMYLRKLIEAGRRVAVCEQIEDAKQAVGLVKRGITRVVTAGTLTDETLLDPRQNNYLLALAPGSASEPAGLAWLDFSAGALTVAEVPPEHLGEEIGRLEPSECLLPEHVSPPEDWFRLAQPAVLTPYPTLRFAPQNAREQLERHFRVSGFAGYGISDNCKGLNAAGALLDYLLQTQKTDLRHISRLALYSRGQTLLIDPVSRRSLELTRTLRENRREGTLLDIMDRTVTAGGARKLADWIHHPLVDVATIQYRQAAVAEWKDDALGRHDVREQLKRTFDLERLATRISTGRTHPRDLACLRNTLRVLPALKAKLVGRRAQCNADLESRLELFGDLRARLEEALEEAPPLTLRDGGIIRPGYSAELDELREIAHGGKQWITQFQQTQAERTGIANLKVGFNKVFGFYLEVTNASRHKVPDDWQRKQTIKNAERYITPELKEYEQKVLGAEDRAKDLEYELFQQLREEAARHTVPLQSLATVLAELDSLTGLAELAATRRYVRPTVVEEPILYIEGGRHPVLDARLPAGNFVPNDCRLDFNEGRFLLITGPNMAGKSTYIRQVALITLMAQIGSFVPAEAATLGIVDRIFARVGASDELSRGQSTFMVEMTETANILNNATSRSLVILDEIGRGTSTYDGVSLAWAITEYLHDTIACRTLFASHYHELIELEKTLRSFRNRNVAVREWKDEIIFLHQIVEGGADRSYGIHVARLAGIPAPVLARAQEILVQLERDPFGEHQTRAGQPRKHRRSYHQLSLFPLATSHPILDALRLADVDQLDGAAALALLRDWQTRLQQET